MNAAVWNYRKDKEGFGYTIIFNGQVLACGLPRETASLLCETYNRNLRSREVEIKFRRFCLKKAKINKESVEHFLTWFGYPKGD